MRNLILVAVILQLAIIIIASNGYEFGDIISFTRKCLCISSAYKHFAVYVGDKQLEGKKPGQDIFHRIGKKEGAPVPDCIFGELGNETGIRENFLDGRKFGNNTELHKGNESEISSRIKALHTEAGCGKYNVLTNNCEHLVTSVRYGYRVTKQGGTLASFVCMMNRPEQCKELENLIKEMEENAKIEEQCMNCTAQAS